MPSFSESSSATRSSPLKHLADVRDQIKAALRAEDAMRQDPCVGVRHARNVGAG
jgi:hypothetical protein